MTQVTVGGGKALSIIPLRPQVASRAGPGRGLGVVCSKLHVCVSLGGQQGSGRCQLSDPCV